MKKIIFIILIVFAIFLIYKLFDQDKHNIVVVGDYNILIKQKDFNNDFFNKNYKIESLIKDIYNNNSLKQQLLNADVLIFSVGNSELKESYKSIDILLANYSSLYKEIKKYAQKKVIILSFYNNQIENQYLSYANKGLKEILKKEENICFLDINKLYINNNNYLLQFNENDLLIKKEELINQKIKQYLLNIFNNNTCQS